MANREGLVALVAVSDRKAAMQIAEKVVEERLAACVQVLPPMRSVYRWEGKVQNERELLLIVKTRTAALARLQVRVGELHSYDTPEIIALPITTGAEKYLRWLESATAR